MDKPNPQISLVFPVFNEDENLEPLYDGCRAALVEAGVTYEMVFVDNGSKDASLDGIKKLRESDPCVRYVSLSRNFGHQGGLFAGVSHSRGDAVITMDADLQHPSSLIPEMVNLWRLGYQVVYTTKRNSRLSGLRGVQGRLFYWAMSRVSGLKLSLGQSDFRLLDRKVADELLEIPEYRKFLRGIVEWVGFKQVGLEYDVSERRSGSSKFSYRSLVSFALDGILAFSTLPLRWMLALGALVALVALIYAVAAVIIGVLSFSGVGIDTPPGWATLAAAVTFLGGVQLIAIGVLGEYVGRIYEQTKGRPVFIVKEASDSRTGSLL